MNPQLFKGSGVALITPFKKDGTIDFDTLQKLVERQIQHQTDFLVILGSTGEAITLSNSEARGVLDCVIATNKGRLPIIAGNFGHNNTAALIENISNYNFEGIDAIMSSVPSYNKPTQEGIFQHFMAIEEASPIPIIIYNVPSRTASNIEASTTLKLAKASSKFVGIKEASNDYPQIMQLLKDRPSNFKVLSGDDLFALPIIASGGDGLISVLANCFPAIFSEMIHAAIDEKVFHAAELNQLMLNVHPHLYSEGNPAGIKAAMAMLGLCKAYVRPPLTTVSDKCRMSLKREIEQVKFRHKTMNA